MTGLLELRRLEQPEPSGDSLHSERLTFITILYNIIETLRRYPLRTDQTEFQRSSNTFISATSLKRYTQFSADFFKLILIDAS